MLKMKIKIVKWIGLWLGYVGLICLIGTIGGVLTHGIYALFCVEPERYSELLVLGMQHGFKYGGVWAGGTAIVLCCIRAHKEQKNQDAPK